MKIVNSKWFMLAGIIAGAALGYLYWHQVGCSTGSCLITSVWYNSTAYGALLGYLSIGMIKDSTTKKDQKNGNL